MKGTQTWWDFHFPDSHRNHRVGPGNRSWVCGSLSPIFSSCSLLFSWTMAVYSFPGVENQNVERNWETHGEVSAPCCFPPRQCKTRPAFPGGSLFCLSLKPLKHMHLFTFQKHFITKMNKRRTVFKLNKLHKYLKSSGLPQEPHPQRSVSLRTSKSIEILDYFTTLPSFLASIMFREWSV